MIKQGVFLLLIFLFLNCSEKKPTGPSSKDFRYPLQIGNEWTYNCQRTLTYDLTSGVRHPEVTQYGVQVKVVGEETLFNSIKTIKLEEQGFGSTFTWSSSSFYQNKADGLFLVSGNSESTVLPKWSVNLYNDISQTTKSFFLLSPFSIGSIDFETQDASLLALKYPLQSGTEWEYTEQNKPRRVNKKVIDETKVTADAGTFKAVKVRWIVDFDGDGDFDDNVEFFDYIADEGLVKRSFLIKNLPVVDDDGGNIGSYDYLDESVLSSFTLR